MELGRSDEACKSVGDVRTSRLAGLTYPDGVVVNYTYDALGRTSQVRSGSTVYGSFSYFADDLPEDVAFGNQVVRSVAYNGRGWPTSIRASYGATTFLDLLYSGHGPRRGRNAPGSGVLRLRRARPAQDGLGPLRGPGLHVRRPREPPVPVHIRPPTQRGRFLRPVGPCGVLRELAVRGRGDGRRVRVLRDHRNERTEGSLCALESAHIRDDRVRHRERPRVGRGGRLRLPGPTPLPRYPGPRPAPREDRGNHVRRKCPNHLQF